MYDTIGKPIYVGDFLFYIEDTFSLTQCICKKYINERTIIVLLPEMNITKEVNPSRCIKYTPYQDLLNIFNFGYKAICEQEQIDIETFIKYGLILGLRFNDEDGCFYV